MQSTKILAKRFQFKQLSNSHSLAHYAHLALPSSLSVVACPLTSIHLTALN